jgi:hypothetical protein
MRRLLRVYEREEEQEKIVRGRMKKEDTRKAK